MAVSILDAVLLGIAGKVGEHDPDHLGGVVALGRLDVGPHPLVGCNQDLSDLSVGKDALLGQGLEKRPDDCSAG